VSLPPVFLNCPFDEDYKPLFAALVFTTFACGFRPRSALEDSGKGIMRYDRLCELIEDCDFGIHDLSRTEANEEGLPRFNMPFELGLFLGAQRFGGRRQKRKQTLVVVHTKHVLGKYLSDLAGVDPVAHEGDTQRLVRAVRDFFVRALAEEAQTNGAPARRLPGAAAINARFREFQKALPGIAKAGAFDVAELDPIEAYIDFTFAVADFLKEQSSD
jgi:hypothetical protein